MDNYCCITTPPLPSPHTQISCHIAALSCGLSCGCLIGARWSMLALFTCLPGPLCPHAVTSSRGHPYYMSASVSRGYEEMLQGLVMLSNLTSTTFRQSAQVTDQLRLIGREWDSTAPSAVTLQKRTCRELAGVYCGHLCTIFHISLSPELAIPFADFCLSCLCSGRLSSTAQILHTPLPSDAGWVC